MIFSTKRLLVAVTEDIFGDNCGDTCTLSGCSSSTTVFSPCTRSALNDSTVPVNTSKLLETISFLAGKFQDFDSNSRQALTDNRTFEAADFDRSEKDLEKLDEFLREASEELQILRRRVSENRPE